MSKKMRLAFNISGRGQDLMIERDAGNEVRILMGKGAENWRRLNQLCGDALAMLEEEQPKLSREQVVRPMPETNSKIRSQMLEKLQTNYGWYYINSGTSDRESKIQIARSLEAAGLVKLVMPEGTGAISVIATDHFADKLAAWENRTSLTIPERDAIRHLTKRLLDLYDRAAWLVKTYEEEQNDNNVDLDQVLRYHSEEVGSLFDDSVEEWMARVGRKVEDLKALTGDN